MSSMVTVVQRLPLDATQAFAAGIFDDQLARSIQPTPPLRAEIGTTMAYSPVSVMASAMDANPPSISPVNSSMR